MDIEKFFDAVDQKKLINLVAEEVAGGRVLNLIQSFLACGVMENMKVEYEATGTPQDGVISPLLANIYLHPYDKKMTEKGFKAVRYADDILVMCKSRTEAEKALRLTKQILEKELNLRLNSQKTKITHKTQIFEFLGFLIWVWILRLQNPPRSGS